jgi:uncharacterized protein (TIGR02246 family)
MALLLAGAFASGMPAAEDPAEIRSRTEELIKAYSAGNAEALAAFWTPSGEYARESVTVRGRDNIQKAYAEHFKKKPAGKLSVKDDTVRFLSDSAAVQEGTLVVERDNPADCVNCKFSVLYVKSQDKWHIGLFREQTQEASLAELTWLIGEWKFKAGEEEGTMAVRLSKGNMFLLIQTTLKEGEEETIATQVLGIDPATGGLRSWTFESDGSIGTAEWVRTEKGWLASVTSTTADGEKVKAVTTITPASRDEFTFASTERTVDGEKSPDIGPVKVTRVATGR